MRAGGVFTAAVLPCLAFLLLSAPAIAQEPAVAQPRALEPGVAFSPFSLASDRTLEPDSDNPSAVRLQLDQPLTLEQIGQAILGQGRSNRTMGTALNYRLDDSLSLSGGMAIGQQSGDFLALGSIHCQNGVLDAVSYRASDCFFVDDASGATARSVMLGASYDLGARASARMNLFRETTRFNQVFRPGIDSAGAASLLDPLGDGYLPGAALRGGLDPVLAGYQAGESERTGVDLEFQVGFSTDQAGDLVLGLQLTRVLDSGTEGVFYATPGGHNWTIARPYDSARLSLDWNRGAFSGGLDSYYRSPVSFLDRDPLDSQATFDVHFTWRAPWNASLSVGASNVLGAGAGDAPAVENNLADPFESIYGRIPYVRYKQDL